MVELRKASERGHANHGWLDSWHSFSFADYHDPAHVSFGPLRVINEDRVQPGRGFGMHGHRDMEIVSYVLAGELEHQDSMGNGSVIRPGDVQRMSAGTGVLHSEFNPSREAPVHFLQIWVMPRENGIRPSYEQKRIATGSRNGSLAPIATPDGRGGSVTIHADANIHAGIFDGDAEAILPLTAGHCAYVHVARGTLTVNGQALRAGDALKLRDEAAVRLGHGLAAEVLVFDLF
jgi:hypothetical protein